MSDQWDVFISYARGDRDYAHRLSEALRERGFAVWWDWDLVGGDDFRSRIRDVIGATDRVLVLWSERSAISHFVIDEASEAKLQGKLVPLSIDGAKPPFGFGGLHTVTVRSLEQDIDLIVASIRGKTKPVDADRMRIAGVGGNRTPPSRRKARIVLATAASGLVALIVVASSGLLDGSRLGGIADALPGMRPTGTRVERTVNRLALVVGNQSYRNIRELSNPVRDVSTVAGLLEAKGFDVVLKTDLDAAELTEQIKRFETTLSIKGGVGLFYYAGNGMHLNGEDIIIPVDADYDVETGTVVRGVNLTMLRRQIEPETSRAATDQGMVIMYSASRGQSASDGPKGEHSPFARAFLEVLPGLTGGIADFYRSIAERMSQSARHAADERAAVSDQPSQSNIVRLRKSTVARQAEIQTPNMETTGNPPDFLFHDPASDPENGVFRILIFDAPRDNPGVAKVLTQ